jgi:hypothetical protein
VVGCAVIFCLRTKFISFYALIDFSVHAVSAIIRLYSLTARGYTRNIHEEINYLRYDLFCF